MMLARFKNNNYEMPSALKQKLRCAKRNFSSNKLPMPDSTTTSTFTAAPKVPEVFSHVKVSKREAKRNLDLVKQKFEEIESSLRAHAERRIARERQVLKEYAANQEPTSESFESELRKEYRIQYIDHVLSEATTAV